MPKERSHKVDAYVLEDRLLARKEVALASWEKGCLYGFPEGMIPRRAQVDAHNRLGAALGWLRRAYGTNPCSMDHAVGSKQMPILSLMVPGQLLASCDGDSALFDHDPAAERQKGQ